MTLYDISVSLKPLIKGMHVYPGDIPFFSSKDKTIHKDGYDLSRLEMGSHSGTHIDVPAHFFPDGATTEAAPLETLVGPAWVADCTDIALGEGISVAHLEALHLQGEVGRIVFKTRNSELWSRDYFQMRAVFLQPDAAQWLVERQVRAVGFDYLSVEKYGSHGYPTHRALLGAGVVIVEGLDLTGVPADRSYDLVCLPLKAPGLDGAPARAILRD